MDVTHFSAHPAMLADCLAALGQIDIVLLAHGTLPDQKACEQNAGLAVQEFITNGASVIALLIVLGKHFEVQRCGTLAVISSVAGDRGRPSNYLYGSAKAAVSTFCDGLQARMFKLGVHVVTIKPGFVDTPMTRGLPLPAWLVAQPADVAERIVNGIARQSTSLYAPGFWGMDHVGDSLDPAAIVQKAQPVTGSLLLSGWRYRAVLLSIVFSAMGYLGFSLWGGWQAVSAATGKVGLLGIGVALLMSAINYALRFVRWQLYLSVLGHPLAWRKSLRIYLAGFALTTTPGKAGEALRGVLLRPLGVPYPQSFAAFVSERLSDLLAIVLLTLFGLSWYPQAQPMILLGLALVLTGSLVLSRRHLLERLQVSLPTKNTRVSSLWQQLFNVLLAARQCLHGNVLLTASLLSLLAWSAEALAFYWMLGWMGAQIPLTFAVFTYALAMLAGALSFMPGGLGSAEAVMVGLLMFKGMPGGRCDCCDIADTSGDPVVCGGHRRRDALALYRRGTRTDSSALRP